MPDTEKAIRLSKIGKELNIGISTIVEFLAGKGHKIDSNPNTKLGEDLYNLLLKEFQSEKTAKEESQQVSIAKAKKEFLVATPDVTESRKPVRDTEQDEILIKNLGSDETSTDTKPKAVKAKVNSLGGIGKFERTGLIQSIKIVLPALAHFRLIDALKLCIALILDFQNIA